MEAAILFFVIGSFIITRIIVRFTVETTPEPIVLGHKTEKEYTNDDMPGKPIKSPCPRLYILLYTLMFERIKFEKCEMLYN